ncbi:MAG: osmoprotectant transport system substrate-binding protein [Cryptosporangiaceae bacterium]|nr:osmoprotectant transport system substrate-binding protein [Cryptosporangiaceae bacterium]
MRARVLTLAMVAVALSGSLAACGKSGSSSSDSASSGGGKGCAPAAGDQLVALDDDKKLQTVDNVIPAVNSKLAQEPLLAALDKVSGVLDTAKLVGLNKATDLDRKSPKVAAQAFVDSEKLTDGLAKGSGPVVVGAANFPESNTLANVYALTLKGAGYDASVKVVGNRELYLPALEKGELGVVPEYLGTLTEFINKAVNGKDAATLASSDVDKTAAELTKLGDKVGLKFGKPAAAADQNAFAVTKKLADAKGIKTLSDFASKCSGSATILGGPAECKQRPFCQPGLEKTYGITFGKTAVFDAAGPLTKNAIKTGKATIGLVLSSDAELASQ